MLTIFIEYRLRERERVREDAKKRRLSVLHAYHQLKRLISEDRTRTALAFAATACDGMNEWSSLLTLAHVVLISRWVVHAVVKAIQY